MVRRYERKKQQRFEQPPSLNVVGLNTHLCQSLIRQNTLKFEMQSSKFTETFLYRGLSCDSSVYVTHVIPSFILSSAFVTSRDSTKYGQWADLKIAFQVYFSADVFVFLLLFLLSKLFIFCCS